MFQKTKNEGKRYTNESLDSLGKLYVRLLNVIRSDNGENRDSEDFDLFKADAKDDLIRKIMKVINYPKMTPEKMHEEWMKGKKEQGFIFGEVFDIKKKIHPCLIPYAELNYYQRFKDAVLITIATEYVGYMKDKFLAGDMTMKTLNQQVFNVDEYELKRIIQEWLEFV